MWTSTITGTDLNNGTIMVNIEFSDGVTKIVETIGTNSLSNLKSIIRSKINYLTEQSNFIKSISTGNFDSMPSLVDSEKETFFTDYDNWKQVKSLIDLGILTGVELKVLALQNKVKSEFKPEYFNL